MKIKDDGIGIADENIIGNGLNNMKRRMENVLGDFDVISNDRGVFLSFRVVTERL